MSEAIKWAVTGYGGLGHELVDQVAQDEVANRMGLNGLPSYVVQRSGVMAAKEWTPEKGLTLEPSGHDTLMDVPELPEVTFVTLPSTDDGKLAYSFIAPLLGAGKTVITAEKGAMANFFREMKRDSDNFRLLGVNATVGGGMHMLEAAQIYCRDLPNVSQLHFSPNGTLTEIFSAVEAGKSLTQAVQAALDQKFAEPGHEDPYDVIRAEATGDIPKKTAIFFNVLGFSGEQDPLSWETLRFELTKRDITTAVEKAANYRFIVSFYPAGYEDIHGKFEEEEIIGMHSHTYNQWRIVTGFRNTSYNSLFKPLAVMAGPGNGVVIGLGPKEKDGVYPVAGGPGAGRSPTINTMLDDYLVRFKND